MKRIIVSECELFFYPELVELYEPDEDEIENLYIKDLFQCDPDYFNFGINNNHLHKIPFIEVLDKYIIVPDDYYIEAVSNYNVNGITEKIKLMLTRFFEDNFKSYFSNNGYRTWEDFNSLNFGIAYRGGSGYVYSLWKYKPK